MPGYDFDTVHKPSVASGPANALSQLSENSFNSFSATTQSIVVIYDAICQAYKSNSDAAKLYEAVQQSPIDHPGFSIKDGLLFYKESVYVLAKFHNSPTRGHAGLNEH